MRHRTPSLRQRLIERKGGNEDTIEELVIPATGRIDTNTVRYVEDLAILAQSGDCKARDQLFFALRPRLDRISWVLKPWPSSSTQTGIWDRDDVRQETWVVFAELLIAWDQSVNFIPYLLARFGWRLRDRILRGIGKSPSKFGLIRISQDMLADILVAGDGEQPESVAIARRLLEELMSRQLAGKSSPGEFDAWLDLIHSHRTIVLASPENPDEEDMPEKKGKIA